MIKIRIHKKTDIPYRVAWLNNKKANIYIGDELGKQTNIKKQQKWFENYRKNKSKKFFTIMDDTKPIGFMGLSNISKSNKNADLFIMIGEDAYRGKGVGKIAMQWLLDYGFVKLKLHKINLGVIERNKPAVKLYKKMGFKIEGVMVDEVFYKNGYYTCLSMALFRKDYKKSLYYHKPRLENYQ